MLRRLIPIDGGELDPDAPDARQTLLDWYAPHSPEHLRLNLVTTLDGRAAGADGTSESLTSRADRMILGVIRQHADVVLVGAESVRRERYVRPRRAALAIVSASGDLGGHRLDHDPDRATPVLVLTTQAGARAAAQSVPAAEVVALATDDNGRIAPSLILNAVRDRGYPGITAEGGPSLAAHLIAAHLVDELCLTIMPRVGGPSLPALGAAALAVTRLQAQQLLLDAEGAQYGRWTPLG